MLMLMLMMHGAHKDLAWPHTMERRQVEASATRRNLGAFTAASPEAARRSLRGELRSGGADREEAPPHLTAPALLRRGVRSSDLGHSEGRVEEPHLLVREHLGDELYAHNHQHANHRREDERRGFVAPEREQPGETA